MPDKIFEKYGITRAMAEDLLDDIAYEKDRNIRHYDMDWQTATDNAILSVFEENSTVDDEDEDK